MSFDFKEHVKEIRKQKQKYKFDLVYLKVDLDNLTEDIILLIYYIPVIEKLTGVKIHLTNK